MEDKVNFIEPLIERAEEYGKTSLELLKLKALDKTSAVVSTAVSRGAVILILTLSIVIANIGAAFWIGDLLGKPYYGFFCVSGFYAVIAGVLYFFMHDSIKKRVSNSIISQLLS